MADPIVATVESRLASLEQAQIYNDSHLANAIERLQALEDTEARRPVPLWPRVQARVLAPTGRAVVWLAPYVLSVMIGLGISHVPGCQPQPVPQPIPIPQPVPPVPPSPPAPIPVAGFRVLIVYDKDTLTDAQQGIVFGRAVRDYLDAKCVMGDDKTPSRRIYPFGVDASGEAQWIRDAIQRHPGQKSWMVISDGKTGYDGAIPANADDALALLKKFGG